MNMDILSDILRNTNMTTSFYYRTDFKSPWGFNIPNYKKSIRFHIVLEGQFWISLDDKNPFKVNPGDIVLIPHGKEHKLMDNLETTILSLDEIIDKSEFKAGELLRYNSSGDASTQLVCGHFEFEGNQNLPLLKSFPDYIHVKSSEEDNFSWLTTALSFIDYESNNRGLGADSIINKLSEIIFIQSMRYYIKHNAVNSLFFSALNDENIRKSIEEVHKAPQRKWAIEDLAKISGLSRTVYIKRFQKLTGITPMNYVAQWRMEKAKKLLKNGSLSVDEISLDVGYAASESFQKTFKKLVGITPSAYRKQSSI